MRAALLLVLVAAAEVRAEGGWLAASTRFESETRYALFGGPGSIGAGAQWRVADSRAWSGEAAWSLASRFVELRAAHSWRLWQGDWVSVRADGGASLAVVPGPWDAGLGPHAGLMLDIGKAVLSGQLGVQSGLELFARKLGPRLPQRLVLGLGGRAGNVGWWLLGRVGADLEPGRAFVGRAEAVLVLSLLHPSG
jgi:hypothetical protein